MSGRIEVDPDELAAITKVMRREVDDAKAAVDSTPDGVNGGVASEPIADVVLRMSAWIAVLGQVHATFANIVDGVASGVLRDEQEISDELARVAAGIGTEKE